MMDPINNGLSYQLRLAEITQLDGAYFCAIFKYVQHIEKALTQMNLQDRASFLL